MNRNLFPALSLAGRVATALFALAALFALSSPALAQGQPVFDQPARLTLKSEVLGEERVILVRTPPGYANNGQRYPVLYMTDGGAHILHTTGTVSFLANNGRMPDMIVVGINNTDRTRDLTPTRVERMPGNPNVQFPTSGGADKFLKFIETELIPHIEANYRTQPFRALAGHSLGGLFAVHAMTARPELFNAYIAVSPSLQWDNYVMIDKAKEFFKSRKDYNRTLYATLGNEPGDIGDAFKLFREVLAKQTVNGFAWEAVQMDDEDHGSVVLRSHYAGLRKVFDGWQLPRDPMTGGIAGDYKTVEAHYQKLTARMNFPVLPPEGLMNFMGYQLLGQGRNDEAISVFKTNVERYPASANVYDSLAEAYEKTGKPDAALPLYEKAATIGKQTGDPNLNVYQANFDRVSEVVKKAGTKTNGASGNK